MTQRLKELVKRWREEAVAKCSTRMLICAGELEYAIKPKWIPVGERLPETHLVKCYIWNGKSIREGFYFSAYSRWSTASGVTFDGVTHWMTIELPEPPGGVG